MATVGRYPYHYSTAIELSASPEEAFALLDDPRNLSSHMGKSSWMMMGSKMNLKLDTRQGRGLGAEIVMDGKVMGIPLFVREFVTESKCPKRKVWETSGAQKMVVIDQYRMGFELSPNGSKTQLKVFIEYSQPRHGFSRVAAKLFSKMYARWCVDQIAKDAAHHFSSRRTGQISKIKQ